MKNALAALALVVNAFCYGVMWWPFRYLQDHGIHPLWATVLVDLVALSFIFAANPKIWRQFIAFPGLWVLLIGAGTISLRVALGGGLILLAALLATLSSKPSPNPSTGEPL